MADNSDSLTVIHLHVDQDPFARIRKEMLNDPNLSWKAKGLLAYLLGKPDNWSVWRRDLINRSTDGRDGVDSAIRELEAAGYVSRGNKQVRASGKFGAMTWHVSDKPMFAGVLTEAGKPFTVKPSTVNPLHTKNEQTKNDGTKKTEETAVTSTAARSLVSRRIRWRNSKRWLITSEWLAQFEAAHPDEYAHLIHCDVIDRLIENKWRDPSGGYVQHPEKYLLATAATLSDAIAR